MRNSSEQVGNIFQRLKEATWEVHQQVEQRIPVFDPEFNLARYVLLLQQFYGFWAPLETKLSHLAALSHPALDLQNRLKSHLLEADLLIFDNDPAKVAYCNCLPGVETLWQGVGCLYVLEGSTLGSRLISRRIESHLHLRAGSGASFFNAYGEASGRRWSEFKSFVSTQSVAEHSAEIVEAAQQTFRCFFEWLAILPHHSNGA